MANIYRKSDGTLIRAGDSFELPDGTSYRFIYANRPSPGKVLGEVLLRPFVGLSTDERWVYPTAIDAFFK